MSTKKEEYIPVTLSFENPDGNRMFYARKHPDPNGKYKDAQGTRYRLYTADAILYPAKALGNGRYQDIGGGIFTKGTPTESEPQGATIYEKEPEKPLAEALGFSEVPGRQMEPNEVTTPALDGVSAVLVNRDTAANEEDAAVFFGLTLA